MLATASELRLAQCSEMLMPTSLPTSVPDTAAEYQRIDPPAKRGRVLRRKEVQIKNLEEILLYQGLQGLLGQQRRRAEFLKFLVLNDEDGHLNLPLDSARKSVQPIDNGLFAHEVSPSLFVLERPFEDTV